MTNCPSARELSPLDEEIDPLFGNDTDSLYYMTDLQGETTGLPFCVWCAVNPGARHGVRVWAAPQYPALPSGMMCLAIRPEIRVLKGKMGEADLALLRQWIDLNLVVLLQHWEGNVDSAGLIDAVLPIKQPIG